MIVGAALVDALAAALLSEERARADVRLLLRRQADLLRQLRGLGLPATAVAQRIAASRGVALPVADRQRLADRLRKRAWRGTRCPVDLAAPARRSAISTPFSGWPIQAESTEDPMAKLVKRTIIEVFEDDKEKDVEVEEDVDQEEEEEDADEDDSPDRSR